MTTGVSPAHAWQRIAACTDRTLTIVDDDTQVITYHDLIAQAAARVPALRELGVAQGEPVLLTAHTSTDFLSVYFGLMLHGAVPVPLPPKQALKGAGQFLGRLGPLLKHHHRLVCTPEEHDEVRTDTSAGRQIIPFASLAQASDLKAGYAAAQQLHADGTTDWPLPAVDDDAYVQYTSGSTAAPRGVVITYRNLLSNLDATGRSLGFRPGDVMASWLPLHHDMGLICSLAAAVFNGIDAVFTIPRRFLHDPLGFLRLTTQTGATHSFMPNFALEWLTNACNKPRADLHGIDLRELRRLLIGSEPVSAESMRRFTTAFTGLGLGPTALCSGYGLAEATCEVTASALDSGFRTEIFQDTEVVTCGRALDGYEIRIDAPPGEQAGHVKLRGPGISSRAYIDGTKLDVLDEEGFCDTNDLGYLAGDELVVLGRRDEVFIIHGENCFPYDIESVVRAASGRDRIKVACFGIDGRIVVVRESRSPVPSDAAGEDRLRQDITTATGLAIDELITVQHGTIPITTSGKIKRKAVAHTYRAGDLPCLTTRVWTQID